MQSSESRPLRIAVVGDFDSVHTRAWLPWFVARGHELHAVSFYPPRMPIDGVRVHALRPARAATGGRSGEHGAGGASRIPRGAMRLAHALRYRRAGLARTLRGIAPDVVHAHFLVEHGFYAAAAGAHPLVVTCWGSDVLVEPRRDPLSRQIAKWTLRRSDAVTSNNRYMAGELRALGADPARTHVVTLGADRYFLDQPDASVNARPDEPGRAPVVLSTRAHEPLYNIGEIIDAFAIVRERRPAARLVIAHGGSLTEALRRRAARLGDAVEFAGFLDREQLRAAMHEAQVFVSVPSSDGTSVALLQAMAAGCFPVVSDLPSQHELVDDGVSGLRAPLHDPPALAGRIARALDDADLRRRAVALNRALVEDRGLNEHEMGKMEAIYRELTAQR